MSDETFDPWPGVLQRIKDLTYFFPKPYTGFDPSEASDGQRARYGLPPEPPEHETVRHAFWTKMFARCENGQPVRFVDARAGEGFTYEELDKTTLPPFMRVIIGGGGFETSANWSGAYVTPRHGSMITEIHGSWTVPEVKRPIDPSFIEPEPEAPDEAAFFFRKRYRCSTWLGLDGQRRYFHSSLPQIGTSQYVDVTAGRRTIVSEAKVWWQWWVRDVENPKPILLPLCVEPNNEIMASLFVIDETHVKYLIANRSKGIICTPFIEPDPTTYLPAYYPPPAGATETHAALRRPIHVSGASAEWITERPANWSDKRMFDLPDYGSVPFKDCHVVTGSAPGLNEREELPEGMRLISMYQRSTGPYRVRTVSAATRDSKSGFTTTYQGPPQL